MTTRPTLALPLCAALILGTGAASAAGVDDLLTKAGCMACHTKDRKLVGPSFKDIAARYKGKDASAALMEKVRKGGSGVYGPIPMPPNPPDKVSDTDLKAMVEFILKS